MAQRTYMTYLIELHVLLTPGSRGINKTRRVAFEEAAHPSATWADHHRQLWLMKGLKDTNLS